MLIFWKELKKAIFLCIFKFFFEYNITPEYHFRFRKGKSTDSVLKL